MKRLGGPLISIKNIRVGRFLGGFNRDIYHSHISRLQVSDHFFLVIICATHLHIIYKELKVHGIFKLNRYPCEIFRFFPALWYICYMLCFPSQFSVESMQSQHFEKELATFMPSVHYYQF